jgi:hypothetical protein
MTDLFKKICFLLLIVLGFFAIGFVRRGEVWASFGGIGQQCYVIKTGLLGRQKRVYCDPEEGYDTSVCLCDEGMCCLNGEHKCRSIVENDSCCFIYPERSFVCPQGLECGEETRCESVSEENCDSKGDNCCEGSTGKYCLGDLVCNEGTGKCQEPPSDCGETNKLCCPGSSCNKTTDSCLNNYCIPNTGCGRLGRDCCSPPAPDCYNGQGSCVGGTCLEEDEICGITGFPCCDPPNPNWCRTLTLYCDIDNICRLVDEDEDKHPRDPDKDPRRTWGDSLKAPPPPTFEGNVSNIVEKILGYLFPIAGLIALIFVVVGGYMWMISAGDPNRVKQAQGTLTWAIIGLFVIAVIFGVLRVLINFLS